MDHDEALEEKPVDTDALREVHDRAMRRFDDAVLPQLPVRELALQARRFADIPGAMWEGAAGDQYGDSIKLEFPKLRRSLRKLENDFRQNRIVPDFRPAGGDSDNDTADTLDGLHRADSYHFKSQQARDNARSEAGKGGFGAYRLTNEWADPLDKDSDHQRVNPASLIADADQCVFFGPSQLYDKSDAKFCFVLVGQDPETFKEDYGDDKAVSWPDELPRTRFDWYRGETIVVAEYYEIEDKDEDVAIFTQETSGEEERHWKTGLEEGAIKDYRDRGFKMRTRKAKRRRCHKYILSGQEVLEDRGYIAGGNIPIVPVYGERAYVDGVEWFRGIVLQNMDTVRVFNAVMSNLYEMTSLAPYDMPIFAPEQMAGNLGDLASRRNIDRKAYILANPLLDPITGGIAIAGPVGTMPAPKPSEALVSLIQALNAEVQADDQDPDEVRANVSADAMDIAAARVDAKSGVFLDNARLSTQREGEIYLDMACEVYVEPDRIVDTMTEDGDDGTATLHEDYSDKGELKVRNNFAVGKYKVIADVTEATATRRDRTVKQMLSVAELSGQVGDGEGAQAALIVAGMNMDGEGIGDFTKWQRNRALKLGLVEPTDDEKQEMAEAAQNQQPDPQQMLVQAQMQKLAADVRKSMAAANLDEAKIRQVLADAGLKEAQSTALGGPEEAPSPPTGLQAANDIADIKQKDARADLHYAQAEHLRHDMQDKTIKTGAQLIQEEHDRNVSQAA